MRCPECDATDNRVVDTRNSRGGRAVRRRRECSVCSARFTTYEYVEERPLQVLKRDGSSEEFGRDKLRRSMEVACAKRPVPASETDVTVAVRSCVTVSVSTMSGWVTPTTALIPDIDLASVNLRHVGSSSHPVLRGSADSTVRRVIVERSMVAVHTTNRDPTITPTDRPGRGSWPARGRWDWLTP